MSTLLSNYDLKNPETIQHIQDAIATYRTMAAQHRNGGFTVPAKYADESADAIEGALAELGIDLSDVEPVRKGKSKRGRKANPNKLIVVINHNGSKYRLQPRLGVTESKKGNKYINGETIPIGSKLVTRGKKALPCCEHLEENLIVGEWKINTYKKYKRQKTYLIKGDKVYATYIKLNY